MGGLGWDPPPPPPMACPTPAPKALEKIVCVHPLAPKAASEGNRPHRRPQRRPQKRVDRRLEDVARAVGGGYCRLQMPLNLALVRETVAGHRLGALEGGGFLAPFQCRGRKILPQTVEEKGVGVRGSGGGVQGWGSIFGFQPF